MKKSIKAGLVGIFLGAVIILGVRFFTYRAETVHYHANFAVYINGQREEFKNPLYYSEVAACGVETEMTPQERAHMHDNVNNVVHVEDHAVTWGQFFENVGWRMGPDFIQKSDGAMYSKNGKSRLSIILNGKDYMGSISNKVIEDKDRVLISYGDENQSTLDEQFQTVASTAAKYDVESDPASCSGSRTANMRERLKHLF